MTNGETLLVRVAGLSGASGEFQLDLDASGGAIAGQVVKSGTNAPRTDADLRLFTSSGNFQQFTRTSPEGTYLFGGIDPGDYLVYVGDDLLVNEVWDDHPCPRCLVTVGDPIPVGSNLVQGIDFALEPGGTISGTLVDATTGDPLSSTTVQAFADTGQFAESGRSDSTGHYTIRGLGEGDHFVVTSSSSHKDEVYDDVPCPSGCDPTTGAPVPVIAGKTTGGIDFALLELGKLSGHVTDSASGAPLPGIRVLVFNDLGFQRATGFSGADGNYLVTRLEDGDYTVATDDFEYFDELYDDLPCEPFCDVTTGVPVPVSAGTTATGVDFSLGSLGRIEGLVLDEETGQPLGSFPGDVDLFNQAGSFVGSHRIGSDGTYRIAGLSEGSYFARVDLSSSFASMYEEELFDDIGCDPSCNVSLGDPIPVFLETTTVGVDFHLLQCTLSSQLELDHQIVISERTFEACRSILVGPETTFTASSDVTLIARESVEFRDGFQIESGGSLRVVIDPDAGKP